jgi:hypothetical protein
MDDTAPRIRKWMRFIIGFAAVSAFVALAVSASRTPLEAELGLVLMAITLYDVFMNVLYARMGVGLIAKRVARFVWQAFRLATRPISHRRGIALSFCGPTILVVTVAVWVVLMSAGAAMVMHPFLGSSIRASDGDTPTDFFTALYAAGSSLSIIGSSELVPKTTAFRAFYSFDSLVGVSALSLTLMYLMQVYSALHARNVLALKIHLMSAQTADAAEILAGLGPGGDLHTGHSMLETLAGDIAAVKESHHFYGVLFFFRFGDPYYSVSRFTLVMLDLTTLIVSALDDERNGWLKESASTVLLRQGSIRLVTSLEDAFLGGAAHRAEHTPSTEERERWQRRYHEASKRLREAGIVTVANEREGADLYVRLRASWDRDIRMLAPAMGYRMMEIDPIGSVPESVEARPPFKARMRTFA